MAADGKLVFDTGIDSSGFDKGLKSLGSLAAKSAAVITAAFTVAASAAVNVGSSFTASMSQVAATMGITRMSDDYQILTASAEEMGAATKFSATQAGNALNYLALAGYDAQQSVEALPTVLNTAAAGGVDLAYASDLITDSMSALGLQMSDLEGFSDKLAKTSQKSNTSVAQLGEAILTVGGTAKSLSGGVEELDTMLGLIADNGIKGAEGGTTLRNNILSLSAPTDTAAAAMERLNVSAFDSQGKMRDLSAVFSDFNAALAPLTDQEKTQALNEIFNKVDLKAVNALLGTSAERFEELRGYIENCSGAAEQMAKTMDDNLTGDLTIMSSALEGLGIAAFDKFEKPMRSAVQTVTEDISALTVEVKDGGLSEQFDKISEGAGRLVTAVGELAANDILPAIINSMAAIIEHGGSILSIIAGIGTAVAAIKVGPFIVSFIASVQTANLQLALLTGQFGAAAVSATALGGGLSITEIAVALYNKQITVATASTAAFNAICSINPIYLVAAALAAVVTGIGLYISHVNKAKAATAALVDETNEYTEAMDKVVQDGQENIDKSNAEIAVIKEKASRYEELRQRYSNLTKGEMAEFKSLAEELQEILPDGTEIINEQTGAYNSLADSIERVCQNMESQAVLNAKYKQYEEAASQNYDINKQLDEIQAQYEKEQRNADLYASEGLSVDDVSSLDRIAQRLYGISYDALVQQRNTNQAIIDEYHQLYSDTYNELNSVEEESTNSYVDNHRLAGQQYADTIKSSNEEMLKQLDANTQKLEIGFEKLDHQYNTGSIATEQELYEKKKALLDKYGSETYKDHWKFYEEIYGCEKDFAEASKKLEEEKLKETAKTTSEINKKIREGMEKNLKDTKDGLKKQLSATKSSLSSIISEYSKAMSDIKSNISGYKNKLLSVGDIFSVNETEKNGQKVKTYTIANIDKQMKEMEKYHSYVMKLKANGASQGLIEDLTSLDFEDGAQFGKYLSGLSDKEFAKINSYYKKRDDLADELSKDMYKGEAEKLNSVLMECVNTALTSLPAAAQTAGRAMLSGIMEGIGNSDDLTERMTTFTDSFAEVFESAVDDMDLNKSFSIALGGIDAHAEGQELGRQFMNGFDEELKNHRSEISVSQTSSAENLASDTSAKNAGTKTSGSSKNDNITIDTTNNITVQIDSETISRSTEHSRKTKERRTG